MLTLEGHGTSQDRTSTLPCISRRPIGTCAEARRGWGPGYISSHHMTFHYSTSHHSICTTTTTHFLSPLAKTFPFNSIQFNSIQFSAFPGIIHPPSTLPNPPPKPRPRA
jgi:hypothetical protein